MILISTSFSITISLSLSLSLSTNLIPIRPFSIAIFPSENISILNRPIFQIFRQYRSFRNGGSKGKRKGKEEGRDSATPPVQTLVLQFMIRPLWYSRGSWLNDRGSWSRSARGTGRSG